MTPARAGTTAFEGMASGVDSDDPRSRGDDGVISLSEPADYG